MAKAPICSFRMLLSVLEIQGFEYPSIKILSSICLRTYLSICLSIHLPVHVTTSKMEVWSETCHVS